MNLIEAQAAARTNEVLPVFSWHVGGVEPVAVRNGQVRVTIVIELDEIQSSEVLRLVEDAGLRLGCQVCGAASGSLIEHDLRGRLDMVGPTTLTGTFWLDTGVFARLPVRIARLSFLYEFAFWFFERGAASEWLALGLPPADAFATYFETFNPHRSDQ